MASTTTRLLAAAAAFFAFAGAADAAFTGDPTADGWAGSGNSLTLGTYVRGGGAFDFDLYRTQSTVDAALAGQPGWLVGDTLLGMGGFISRFPDADPATNSPGEPNPNLTGSVRIVSKFTSGANGHFTASTTTAPPGDGLGSFSGGNGGAGSVLISTVAGAITGGSAGAIRTPDTAQQYTGTAVVTVSTDDARYVYTVDSASGLLRSWEVLLNASLVGRNNPALPAPDYDGRWDQALQRGPSGVSTDALNVPTPLPPTLVALLSGAGLLGLGRAGRRRVAA